VPGFGDATVPVRVRRGEPAFLALAAAHHARCLADPELSHPFGRLLWMHSRTGDMGDLGRRFVTAFVQAADDVLGYSALDATVPVGASMPRWSWDGLVA
jgi:hemoglobin